jgi:hypothetical protein
MTTQLVDYIRCYDNVLDSSFCTSVIETFKYDLLNQERVEEDKKPSLDQLNVTKQYLKENPKWINTQLKIQKVFLDFVNQYIREVDILQDLPPKYTFEEYRIKRYTKKTDQYVDHVDIMDYNSARRFITCFAYLNTIPDGGETQFPRLDFSVSPIRGRLVIFPSNWLYRYAERPSYSLDKFTIGSYLHYL